MEEFSETNPIRIVMADDHEVVRAGIRRLLSVDKSIKILDEASNGKDLVDLVKYHNPDVVLTDIMMPIQNGIEATLEIKEKYSFMCVIMLTAYEDSFHLDKALSAGADGYLSKDVGAKELIESIHNVMKGDRVFSKSIIKLTQKKYIPEDSYESTPIIITKREQEILNLVSNGKTSAEIADKLFLSVRTVESHRYNLMQKLGIKNAAGLARYSIINKDNFQTNKHID
jgi:DNA-binding NarL/FixJ family response regulator